VEHREHLLVQAGTGTGKSLGYLVPALLHDRRVVVATATLALQHQLVERDIPALLDAVGGDHGALGEKATYAVLKGRSNYACLHRIREGVPDDQGVLVDVPEGSLGAEVLALREWAEEESDRRGAGDRDSAPKHTDRVWRQVSVNHRECLGAAKCPYADECFAERAKEKAAHSQLVVTNHSLLAIDAIEGVPMIPEYDAVVIDEAHELSARVTQAATDELSAPEVERAARRSQKHIDGREADELTDAADTLRGALDDSGPGRIDKLSAVLSDALDLVRDSARALLSAFPKESAASGPRDADAGFAQSRGWVQEIFKTAERMAANLDSDVLWIGDRDPSRDGARLHVAPLQVWGPLRDRLLHDKTAVFTSATLMLGGDFSSLASSIGLSLNERVDHSIDPAAVAGAASQDATTSATAADAVEPAAAEPDPDDDSLPWRGIDVGSPFDYRKQGIVYVAKHLPPPGRDGLGPKQLDEIGDLVDAADGRTLGLFSSRRAADAAAEALRERLPHLTVMAQGEAQLSELARLFVEDPHACLFGTLSLWQGLDVPGDTCQLVLIDRIPFPRPDDPLMSARALAADRSGGNGFMSVSATHAALLLAQGTGRLIRTSGDRGVVAILDPRLVTARYGAFLRASLPPMWPTTDRAVVLQALERLSRAATEVAGSA
jgi:ATP-dependent DNA helicase DinG